MQNIRKMGALLGAGAIMLTLVGCGGNADGGNSGSDVANAASNNLGETANAAANGAAAVGNSVAGAGAGKMVANGAANAGKMMDAATLTPQIKTAFGGNKALNGSKIDVDTAGTTVTLSGTVTSAAQKTLAGSIAKQKATGYTITNNLKVGK